ncbi:unnamed protein product [Arabis nemorensis]|uniref:Uncharacterized protein n=1 Tax=Arabis nemorensis TaxID=586526 RepID=A0A565CCG7_9BRAS|nr:unnamed protein product [Arabis nemorensis]
MKLHMRKRFALGYSHKPVKDPCYQSHNIPRKPMYQTTSKKMMLTPTPFREHKYAYHSEPKRVFSNTSKKHTKVGQTVHIKTVQQNSIASTLFQPQVEQATSRLRIDGSWPSKGVEREHKKSYMNFKKAKECPKLQLIDQDETIHTWCTCSTDSVLCCTYGALHKPYLYQKWVDTKDNLIINKAQEDERTKEDMLASQRLDAL